MKRMLFVSLICCGCSLPPVIEGKRTNNPKIHVDELFTHDGVTVYRFEDAGRYVYFTSKGDTRTAISERCGKGCTRTVIVEALNGAW